MKKIWILTQATSLYGEPGYNRFRYISEILAAQEYDVTLVTSSFNHYNKKQRSKDLIKNYDQHYKLVLINEIGYHKNVSVKRIISHFIYGSNLKKFIKNSKDYPDIILIGLPPFPIPNYILKFKNKHGIKTIIDINDLWPEAMKNIIRNTFIYKLITFGLKKEAIKYYRLADHIIAVSNEYVDFAKQYNDTALSYTSIYIGAFIEEFDLGVQQYKGKFIKPHDEFWIVYIGTLGHSYDLRTLLESYKILKDHNYDFIKLKILGRGPLEKELKSYSERLNLDTQFIGYLDYKEMAAYLSLCDVAINAIVSRASQSIINKVADYFASGLPVLNSSLCNEMMNLIDDYNCGINYKPEDPIILSNSILEIYSNPERSKEMGQNARNLAIKKFNRNENYKVLFEIVNQ